MSSGEPISGQDAVIGWVFDALKDVRDSTNHEWTKGACDRILNQIPSGEEMTARFYAIQHRHDNYKTALSNVRFTLEYAQVYALSLSTASYSEDQQKMLQHIERSLEWIKRAEQDAYYGNAQEPQS